MNKYEALAIESRRQRQKYYNCQRKRGYDDYGKAHDDYWDVYECPWCGRYHRKTPLSRLVKRLNEKRSKQR